MFVANEAEVTELLSMVDELSGEGLNIFFGWIKTSEQGIAITPKDGIRLLKGYL